MYKNRSDSIDRDMIRTDPVVTVDVGEGFFFFFFPDKPLIYGSAMLTL